MKCSAGEFLNQTLGRCVPCAAGEFSLGNAIRYEFNNEARKRYQQQVQNSVSSNTDDSAQTLDVWRSDTLSEFSRYGSPDNDMPRDPSEEAAFNKKKAKCSKYDFQVCSQGPLSFHYSISPPFRVLWDFSSNGHLEVRTVPGCVASLTLSVAAQRPGRVRFEYQYSRSSSLFGFEVRIDLYFTCTT